MLFIQVTVCLCDSSQLSTRLGFASTYSFLPISKLSEEPYSTVLAYPKPTKPKIKSRIKELKKLGIKSVSFQGELKLGTLNVLGKGYVGVVVLAKNKKKKVRNA